MAKSKTKKKNPIITLGQIKRKLHGEVVVKGMTKAGLFAVEEAPNGDVEYIFDKKKDLNKVYKAVGKELGDPLYDYPISMLYETTEMENTVRLRLK